MVGRAPSTRARLVILVGSCLSNGTLKSTRMKTRLPFTSTSVIWSLSRVSPVVANMATLAGTFSAVFSLRAAIPGNTLPSNSSKLAPPPVLTWLTLSSVLYTLHAVAVSPPPITVVAPCSVTLTISSIMVLVPAAKDSISNTPMGPFQMMVLADWMVAVFSLMVSGPQSNPIMPSGIPASRVAVEISPPSPNSEEVTKSTGSTISTPLASALAMISGTILAPASSYREPPMAMSFSTFWKVKAIPPPMIILSTLSNRFSISRILSDTLAPPKMANTGRDGSFSTLPKASSSLATRKPDARTGNPSPTMELWPR
mmetsp:Transcript_60200/g.99405  ORF Transcript_60200/g.99405 Transcript_60200/m.99405 type:complete len:313 (+) Transcript_60200:1374-2312(+)